jgi:hypothetical protein
MLVSGDIESIMSSLGATMRFVVRMGGQPGDVRGHLAGIIGLKAVYQTDNLLTIDLDEGSNESIIGTLVQALVSKGVSVVGVERQEQDLESLFLRVTDGHLAS